MDFRVNHKTFTCAEHGRPFQSQAALDQHLKALNHNSRFYCDDHQRYFKDQHAFDQHMNSSAHPSFYCKVHERIFQSQSALDQHLNSSAHREVFYCEVHCKSFNGEKALNQHKNSLAHSSNRSQNVQKSFTNQTSFKTAPQLICPSEFLNINIEVANEILIPCAICYLHFSESLLYTNCCGNPIHKTCFDPIKSKTCPYCRKKNINLKNESHNFERMLVQKEFQEIKCEETKMEHLIKEDNSLKNESHNFERMFVKKEFEETKFDDAKIYNLIKSFTGLELLEKGTSQHNSN